MSVKKKWVVFDLIGVLAEPSWRDVARIELSRWYELRVGETTVDRFWTSRNNQTYLKTLGFRRDMLELARDLKEKRGYSLCIASNFSNEWFEHLRKKEGIGDLFEKVLVSETVKHAKPEPEFFAALREIVPAGTAFIDDQKHNCDASRTSWSEGNLGTPSLRRQCGA